MRLRLFAVAALALACFASSPASAHHHRYHHHYHHTHHYSHRHHYGRHAIRYRQDEDNQPNRPEMAADAFSDTSALVRVAARDLGATARDIGVRTTLWCMAAVNHWLHEVGLPGTGSDSAFSALALGPHLRTPQVGALAVMGRRGGGHVGVVAGVTEGGDPIIISGNHTHNRVGESVYPKRRIIAYIPVASR